MRSRWRIGRGTCVFVLVSVGFAFVAAPAEASFPGRNGVIAFAQVLPAVDLTTRTMIRTIDPRSGRTRQLTRPSRRCPLPRDEWFDVDPSYSASGGLIVYHHMDSCDPRVPDGIYVMRSDGTGRRLIWPEGSEPLWESPTFSPNGRWLAFSDYLTDTLVLDRSRPRATLRRMSDISALYRYTYFTQPSWGSTGRLALTLSTPWWGGLGDIGNIGTVTPSGEDLKLVTRSKRDAMADWSPRGDRIAFQRYTRERNDVWVAPARQRAHRRPRRLTATHDARFPAWSPNGRHIAYVRTKANMGSLWIMRASDGGGQRLIATGIYRSQISWQPRTHH